MSPAELPVAGMLLIDKPADWTSHDCVAVLRKLFPRNTKVGHIGARNFPWIPSICRGNIHNSLNLLRCASDRY